MDSAHDDLTFNVAQLLKERVGATRKLDISTPRLILSDETITEEDVTAIEASDVEGTVKVTLVSPDLLVQGTVAANVKLACSRCLDEFMLPVTGSLEERYEPVIDIETGRAIQRAEPDADDDSLFNVNANHEMDLTEPIRQALLVALPMRPLCSEDCKGLCPECGKNLNDGPCDCPQETVDNRWAALTKLKMDDFPADTGPLI